MPCPKPHTAVYKDSVVVYLALKAQFAIADNHPKEENMSELGKMMLLHVPNPNFQQTESWKGGEDEMGPTTDVDIHQGY
jgi:hypothetical protein